MGVIYVYSISLRIARKAELVGVIVKIFSTENLTTTSNDNNN